MAKAITKAGERIEKPVDVKLNVLPIFGSLIHLYAYEGPCRFGGAEELTNEFDSNAPPPVSRHSRRSSPLFTGMTPM